MSNTIRDYVANHFEKALRSGCVTVCYEPILRALTGKICSFEALARWHDPICGNISPQDFIPVLEAHDKIHLLDYFVIKVTVQNLHARKRQGLPIVPIVVNLSRRDFLVSDPVRVLNHLTEKYQLPHLYIQIEITETAFVENEAAIAQSIKRLRQNGYTVTLDNFGEGQSSLAALHRCAIDEISLNKVFFKNFTENTRLLLSSILLMAKTLRIHTAAEGVQTEEQADFLRRIGCEKLQGPCFRMHGEGHYPDDDQPFHHFETCLEQQVFQQSGLVNLITDTPVGLFTDDGESLQLLTANNTYMDTLRRSNIHSITTANERIRNVPQFIEEKMRSMADMAIRSHQTQTDIFIINGHYFLLTLHNLADTNGFYIHQSTIHFLPPANTAASGVEYDLVVRHLMQFYQDIYLIDSHQNLIQIITANISSQKTGTKLHGIMTTFMRFSQEYIHPDDHQRFLHFIHRMTEPAKRNRLTDLHRDLFRVKMPNGSYHWKTFSLTSFRHEDRPCQLLCLRNFIFEELPERDKLINTVMASYGFTNLPSNLDGQISDATLWRTLTQFSHRKLFWKDKQGRFRGASPAFLRYYGIQNINELIDKTDHAIGWHISDSEMEEPETRVLKEGLPIHNGQGRCIARGRQHSIAFSKYPIYEGTRIVGLLGEFRDVEEERNYHKLQRKLYLIDEATDFYNYRGMVLASVEFADNLRLNQEPYTGAMLQIPEFDSIAKLYGPTVGHAALQHICAIIRKDMPASTVAAHTGSGIFVLFLKNHTVGSMRRFIEQAQKDITAITEIDGFACTFSLHYSLEAGSEARTSDEFLKILSSRCFDYLPSFGITGTLGDKIPLELEKFDHLDRLIYITDYETYDLVYVNPAQLHYRHLPPDYQYAGQKCYRLFTGLQAPCANCPKDKLQRDRFHFRPLHSLRTGRDYHVWNTLINWNNRQYILSDAIDVHHMMELQEKRLVPEPVGISANDIAGLAIQEEDPHVGLLRMMEGLGYALNATHTFLIEEEDDGFHLSCTYEWHNHQSSSWRRQLQHVPVLAGQAFYDAFRQDNILVIDNAAQFQERHREIAPLFPEEPSCYVIGQLKLDHRSRGCLVILNPDKAFLASIPMRLQAILRVTAILMRNRDNIQKLQEISTIDQLTGVGNRRALTNFVKEQLKPGVQYAVIFADINHLKKMNDTFGHERGDLLIQTMAYILVNAAGKNHVFRLGGDEFLAISPCQDDTQAVTILDHIENSMHIHQCSAALGYVLCLAPFSNLEALIHQADEKMYRDKTTKHLRREDD